MRNTWKKIIMAAAGVCFGTALMIAVPEEAHAYPCTIDIINTAKAQKSAAEAELLIAQNNQAAADAAFAAAKANGASELELTQTGNAAATAANLVRAAVDKVNNAQTFIENGTKRLAKEDEYEANVVKWGNQVKIAQAKEIATGAKEIANQAAAEVLLTKQSIAAQTAQLSVCPDLQITINTLNASLPALEKNAAEKLAVANEKAAIVANLEATLVH